MSRRPGKGVPFPRYSLDRPETPVKGFNAVPVAIYVNGSGHIRRRLKSSYFRSYPELRPI